MVNIIIIRLAWQGCADYFTKARNDCFSIAIPLYDRWHLATAEAERARTSARRYYEGSNIKVIDATIKHEAPVSLPVPRLESPRGARFNASIFFPRPFAEPEPRISTLVSWLNACYYLRQDFSSAVQPFFFFSFFVERKSQQFICSRAKRINFYMSTCVSVSFRSKLIN